MLIIGAFFLFWFAVLRHESPPSTLILLVRSMTDNRSCSTTLPAPGATWEPAHPDASRKSELECRLRELEYPLSVP